MGFFSRLFGKKDKKEADSNSSETVFYASPDERMSVAIENAQKHFKYFWRELYWEHKRIVPGHNFAMIKIPFKQAIDGEVEPLVEHMWINNIDFDGENITGILVNEPNELTNVSQGDNVSKKVNEIGDWMISIGNKVLGGFTIQAMRAEMSQAERQQHDNAWGLNFGDFNETLVVYEQKKNPNSLIEHPMSVNMGESLKEFLSEHPNEISQEDEHGLSFLHREAIAGNKTSIQILLDLGADKNKKSAKGKTPLEYAQLMKWEHLYDILQ